METPASGGTCGICDMNPKFTHTVNEHEVAERWMAPLLEYVKTDAFSRGDRPLTYAAAIPRFGLDTSVRRVGRVLDAVERILVTQDWPPATAAGVTAYVVNSGSKKPGNGWAETWNMDPKDARELARARVRALTLDD